MKKFWAAIIAALATYAAPLFAANYTDHWWNKDESGWGVTLAHHNDKLFAVWYVYDTDGKPLWVVMPDGAFSSDGRSFSGQIYKTTGPSYRAGSFSPSSVTVNAVGSARFDFAADENNATVTYSISTVITTKQIAREPFGNAPANGGTDYSDIWWNPSESGWGITITNHGNNLFAVWYAYDDNHQPLWVVMPGGTFTNSHAFTGKLYTTTGSPFTGHFDPHSTQVTEVGTATFDFSGTTAKFTSTVRGFTQAKTIQRQAFGNMAVLAADKKPVVSLAIGGGSNATAPATIQLTATASDPDGSIAKVVFYEGCDPIGSVASAPFKLAVPNLAAGQYNFSARAVDNLGASTLVTSAPIVVAASGGGTTTPPVTTDKPPTVSIATPATGAYFAIGAAVSLTAKASDPDGTVAKVEYFVDMVKVGESSASPWNATWPAVSGGHSLTAIATDDMGVTATSDAITVTVANPAVVPDNVTRDAARFLTQATFGPRGVADIQALSTRGYDAWLTEQFGLAAPSYVKYVNDRKAAGDSTDEMRAYEAVWQQWLFDPGQLRARMSFALSEIFVISNVAPDLDTYAMASYMDMLNRDAFGNYRQLIEDVTLHPAMGYYLNMIGSKKADPVRGTHPNENYAREVMQLFSIGLHKLNPDATLQLDSTGQAIPTYDQNVVTGMAAAFSGWNFAGNDTSDPRLFDPAKEDWLDPLLPWEALHDTNVKTLFDGITLPAGQGARADMKGALDALFNHPNVGPFIGRELIQRFVTSNPSPAYVGRVAAVFANNGSGVRGDLKATLRAVLMDPEARDLAKAATPTWGKQREPVIRFANYLRAFNATSTSGRNHIWFLDDADEGLNQSPLLSPSVFNFFSPNYRPPGGQVAALGMAAPEFQITTETSMVGSLNFFGRLAKSGSYGSGDTQLNLDLAELNTLAADPAALADRLNLLMMCGGMSDAFRANLITALAAMPAPRTGGSSVNDRVKAALILVAFAPDFAIQK